MLLLPLGGSLARGERVEETLAPLPRLRLLKQKRCGPSDVEDIPRLFSQAPPAAAHAEDVRPRLPPSLPSPAAALPPRGRLLRPVQGESSAPALPAPRPRRSQSPAPASRPARLAPLQGREEQLMQSELSGQDELGFAAILQQKSRERVHNWQSQLKKQMLEEEQRRQEEMFERQERVTKAAPQIEAQRRELAKRAADLFRRDREGQKVQQQELEDTVSERREKTKLYMTPDSRRHLQKATPRDGPAARRRPSAGLPPLEEPPRKPASPAASPTAGGDKERGRRAKSSPTGSRARGTRAAKKEEAAPAEEAMAEEPAPAVEEPKTEEPTSAAEQPPSEEAAPAAEAEEKAAVPDEEAALAEEAMAQEPARAAEEPKAQEPTLAVEQPPAEETAPAAEAEEKAAAPDEEPAAEEEAKAEEPARAAEEPKAQEPTLAVEQPPAEETAPAAEAEEKVPAELAQAAQPEPASEPAGGAAGSPRSDAAADA